MESETVIWITLTIAWVILFILDLRTYFFARTLHKICMKYSLAMNKVNVLMPPSYATQGLISKLRWVVVIALFFYSWIAAIICLVAEFVLPIKLPEEDDYKNLLIMKKYVESGKVENGDFYLGLINSIINTEFGEKSD